MVRWYIYRVEWRHDLPPFARNLRVANARLLAADHEAPLLTEEGFVGRWRSPLITAKDVYRILYEANCNVGRVWRWECTCDDWSDCDAGLTDCHPRRAYRDESTEDRLCDHFDENYEKFERHNSPTKILKSKRNVGKWHVGNSPDKRRKVLASNPINGIRRKSRS